MNQALYCYHDNMLLNIIGGGNVKTDITKRIYY